MISKDGGLKAGYEQRSNEIHLGVGDTDLATVNTFTSVERVLEAGWMNIGFSVFLTNLVSTKAIVVIVQQDSCTRRISAYSHPQRDIRTAGWAGEDVGWYGCGFMDPFSAGIVHIGGVRFSTVRSRRPSHWRPLSFSLCLLVREGVTPPCGNNRNSQQNPMSGFRLRD